MRLPEASETGGQDIARKGPVARIHVLVTGQGFQRVFQGPVLAEDTDIGFGGVLSGGCSVIHAAELTRPPLRV